MIRILKKGFIFSLYFVAICSELFSATPISKTIYRAYPPTDRTKTIKVYNREFTPDANAEIVSFVIMERTEGTHQELIQNLIEISYNLGGDAVWLYESNLFDSSKLIASVVRENNIQELPSTVRVSSIDTILRQQSKRFWEKKFIDKKIKTRNIPLVTLSADYGLGSCWDTRPITNGGNLILNSRIYFSSGAGLGLCYESYVSSYDDTPQSWSLNQLHMEYIGLNYSMISTLMYHKLYYVIDVGLGYERSNQYKENLSYVAARINLGVDYVLVPNLALSLNFGNMIIPHSIFNDNENEYGTGYSGSNTPRMKTSISLGLKLIFPR